MAPRKGTIPPNKKFTSEAHVKNVLQAYRSGLSTNRIAVQLGCSRTTIGRVLADAGEPLRFSRPAAALTEMAVRLYSRMSGVEVARLCNTTPTTIYGRLKKAGVVRRHWTEYGHGSDCDHEYFDRIDTEEKAYWLMMINADGCVTAYNDLVLSLQASDAHHVERFRKAISAHSAHVHIDKRPQRKLIHGKVFWTRHASLTISSPHMVAMLIRRGIVPNKTGRTVMPTGIPKRLLRHAWRGGVDGDGWVTLGSPSGDRISQAVIGFTGDRAIVESWREFCSRYSGTRAAVQPNHQIWRFCVTDSHAVLIGRKLYEGASLFLDRKYAAFQRILAEYSQRRDFWGNPTRAARATGLV